MQFPTSSTLNQQLKMAMIKYILINVINIIISAARRHTHGQLAIVPLDYN